MKMAIWQYWILEDFDNIEQKASVGGFESTGIHIHCSV